MKRLWAAVGLATLVASPAAAQTANNPTFTREQQGGTIVSGQVTCTNSSTEVYAGNGDARSITLSAADANGVYICLKTGVASPATPVPCTAAGASAFLGAAGQWVKFNRSVKSVSVYCLRSGGSNALINYTVER